MAVRVGMATPEAKDRRRTLRFFLAQRCWHSPSSIYFACHREQHIENLTWHSIMDKAQYHFDRGLDHMDQHQWRPALNEFQKAHQYAPRDAEILCNMGFCAGELGELDAALGYYGESLKIKPAQPDVYHDMAVCQTESGQFDAAVATYQQAIRFGADADTHWNLGLLYQKLGRIADALEVFKSGVRLAPSHSNLRFCLGVAASQCGDPQTLKEQIAVLARIDPQAARELSTLVD
jgi:tetratricopeptide (TPR) repeat protein